MQCRVLPRIEKWAHVKQVLFSQVLWAAGARTVMTSISGYQPKAPLWEPIKGFAWKSSVADCIYTLMLLSSPEADRDQGCTPLLTWRFSKRGLYPPQLFWWNTQAENWEEKGCILFYLLCVHLYTETETVGFRREKMVPTCAPINCRNFVVKLVFGFFLRVVAC